MRIFTLARVRQVEPVLSKTFVSLNYRDYRLIWIGSVTEHTGEFMELAAVLWLAAVTLNASPFMLTLVAACTALPIALFAPLGGVLADRFNRRNIVIGTLLGMTALSLTLTTLVITERVALWNVILIALGSGSCIGFNHPARQALFPNLVRREHLMNAIALDNGSVMAARLVGMSAAGILIEFFGVTPVFGLRALGLLMAILWLLPVRSPPIPPEVRHRPPLSNLTEGLGYLGNHRIILILVALYLLPMFAMRSYMGLLPIFARDIFQMGGLGYGLLMTAPGVGSLLSLLTLATFHTLRHRGVWLFTMGIVTGLALAAFGPSPWILLSLLLLVVIGAANNAFMTLNAALVQGSIPDHVRGRVMSLREIAFGLGPAGSLLIGALAQATDAPFAVAILGVIVFAIPLLLALALPRVRQLD